jgi:hypothetical protein
MSEKRGKQSTIKKLNQKRTKDNKALSQKKMKNEHGKKLDKMQ